MKLSLAVTVLVVTSIACSRGERSADAPARTEMRSLRDGADSQLIAHLEQLSRPLKGDTIHLYSAEKDSSDTLFGRPISPDDRKFFRAFYEDVPNGNDIFAVGYVTIAPNFTAYVLRVPSQYSSSAVALLIRNKAKGYWLPPTIVADAFGDEAWSFQQDAWRVDRDHDGDRDLVQRRIDSNDGKVVADTLK